MQTNSGARLEEKAFGALKRAAESLGMTASQEGSSLKVLSGGYGFLLSKKNGEVTWTRYHGPVPAWLFSAGSALVAVLFLFSAIAKPISGWNAVLLFVALCGALSEMESRVRFQRLQARLVDRAYDLGRSATAW